MTAGAGGPWRRRVAPAQGGRALPARPRPLRRRHHPARHAGGGVPAQPRRACAAAGRHQAGRRREARVHARGPAGRAHHPRQLRPAGLPRLRAAGAGRRTSCAMSARRSRRASPATRAEAEDLAAACELDYETLPAVHDMLAAPLPAPPLVHDDWAMNAFLETRRDDDVSEPRRHRRRQGDAHAPHRAPVHGADRGQGRAARMGHRGSSR